MPYGRTFRRFTFTQPAPKQRIHHNEIQHKHNSQQHQQQHQQPAHAHAPPPHPPEQTNTERVRWRITNDMDWSVFRSACSDAIQEWIHKYELWGSNNTPHTLTQTQIDACWSEWLEIITLTAEICIGTSNPPPNSKEWWHFAPDIQTLHKTYRKARNDMRAARRRGRVVPVNDVLDILDKDISKPRGAFRTAVNDAKKNYWNGVASAIDETDINGKHKPYWARLKRAMPKHKQTHDFHAFTDDHAHHHSHHNMRLNNIAAHLAHISSILTCTNT